jgi:hypothetical protein
VVKGSFHGENPFNDRSSPDQPLDFGNWAEIMSYVDVLPVLNAPAPPCFGAHWDTGSKSGYIVMEDLAAKGVRFLDYMTTLSYAEASAFMDSLARMHAQYWESDELRSGGRFGPDSGLADRSRGLRGVIADAFVKLGAASREEKEKAGATTLHSQDHLVPRMFHDKQRQAAAAQRMFEITDSYTKCVVHGDEHLRNLYIDANGGPGFLDWCSRIEGWPLTVGYFLVNCLDALDRRQWEKPLLAHYLHRLEVYGARAPGFEDAFFGYRCGAMFALLVWANNRAAWQPMATNSACTVRAAAAIVDLDSFSALGV